MSHALLLGLLILALAGCGPALYRWDAQGDPRAERSYTVESGDTLYSIAFRYGLDYRRLAEWNGIEENFVIHPGDELRLLPPGDGGTSAAAQESSQASTTPLPSQPLANRSDAELAVGELAWQWPYQGEMLAHFGDGNGMGKGVLIEGIVGDPVLAAAPGKVVYAGSGLVGYGRIIIVKHSEKFLSAYGHNSQLFVREGEQVRQGDRIAAMGRGPGNRPLLHFEIRLNGKAVDPMRYLPKR